MNDSQLRTEIIDSAFRHTENKYVIKQLLGGKPWSIAMGIGGSWHPVNWKSNSKGITYQDGFIGLPEIYERLEHYKPSKPNAQLTLF